MAKYIEREALDKLIESRKVRGDCKFCAKYERCIANGINRKGSHLYCWEQLKLPTADVVEVVRCKDCKYSRPKNKSERNIYFEGVLICESCEMADEPCAVCETDFCSNGEKRSEG